ncbi:VOC family protein [soil metagenome]
MSKMIFVNLPVTDLAKSIAFYQAVGATRDDRFGDETAQCMVISDTIHVMLLTHAKFSQFTTKQIPDAHETAQALLCLSEDSRAALDDTMAKALDAGAHEPRPAQDFGMMYGRAFEDPDGHIWELMWMDLDAFLVAQAPAEIPA